jgi:hypothetical protein
MWRVDDRIEDWRRSRGKGVRDNAATVVQYQLPR